MSDTVQVLLPYGYVVLFAFVLAEQIGLPIPAVPVLLGVGALAGTGGMSLALALGAALVASLPPDLVRYELGRRRGWSDPRSPMSRLLEPDSCVRRAEKIARITPDELKRRLDAGDADLVVIDTRSALDVNAAPYTIPGALWIAAEEMDRRGHEVPRDREIVLYCT
jgi:hypothetical protein